MIWADFVGIEKSTGSRLLLRVFLIDEQKKNGISIDMISGQILDGKNIKQAANLLQQGDVSIPKYVNAEDCALVYFRKVGNTDTMYVYLRRTATEYLNAGYTIIVSDPVGVFDGNSEKCTSINITNHVGSTLYIFNESDDSERTLATNHSNGYTINDGALLISLTSIA